MVVFEWLWFWVFAVGTTFFPEWGNWFGTVIVWSSDPGNEINVCYWYDWTGLWVVRIPEGSACVIVLGCCFENETYCYWYE